MQIQDSVGRNSPPPASSAGLGSRLAARALGIYGRMIEPVARVRQYVGIAAGSLGLTGARALAGPLHAQVGICDPCNHECVFCWDHPPKERQTDSERFGYARQGVMPLERFKSVVDDVYKAGTRRIDIVGRGEPLLNPAVLDMVSYAKQQKMLVLLCSNASRLATKTAEGLVDAGLDRLNVSLNAGKPESYPDNHVTETPENYIKVKSNLRYLADYKARLGSAVPHMRLSFVISTKNYFELEQMVRVTAEVGAQEAMFTHTVVNERTQDLALSQEQYQELLASGPAASAAATELGIDTNVKTLAATIPSYLEDTIVGPRVVPCYAGYYFTFVLANGSVLPCCQCSKSIGRITEDQSFADVWASDEYRTFRRAAKKLPEPDEALSECECDRCMLRPRNISIHNFLHPTNPIDGGDKDQLFSVSDLLRMKKSHRR